MLASLGLCCFGQVFLVLVSRAYSLCCSAWATHCCGFSCFWSTGPRVQGLQEVVVPWLCSIACGIFPDKDRTHVPCTVRWILNHQTTTEALEGEVFTEPPGSSEVTDLDAKTYDREFCLKTKHELVFFLWPERNNRVHRVQQTRIVHKHLSWKWGNLVANFGSSTPICVVLGTSLWVF